MMSNTCSIIDGLLVAYDDGELTTNERAAEVSAHLKICEMCARKLRQIRDAMSLLSDYLSNHHAVATRVDAAPHRVEDIDTKRDASSTDDAYRDINIPLVTNPHCASALPVTRAPIVAALPTWRARRSRAWLAVAAALLIFVAGGVVFLSGNISGQTAMAAMTEIADGLKDLQDFTARFERTYTYIAPRPNGYNRAQATGLVRYKASPQAKLACEESWKYFDSNNADIPELTEKHIWGRTATSSFDLHEMLNSFTGSSSYHEGWLDELLRLDIVFQDEEMLPPQPQREAYEIACLLRGIAEGEYCQWFGKKWKNKNYVSASGSKLLMYEAQSGFEVWTLMVEVPTSGGLILKLDQTLTDSNGNSMGAVSVRYETISVNAGLADSIFEEPANKIPCK